MTEREPEFAISRRALLKAAGVTAVTGGVLTTPVTAEQPGNSEENRRDQENRPEGVGTSPQGIGTSPLGLGTSPMGFGTSPLADENIE